MRSARHVGTSFITIVMGLGFLLAPGSAQSASDKELWLITPEEAAMASAKKPPDRDLTQIGAESSLGPKIEVLKPPDGSVTPSPVEVDVKFRPTISPVDPASMKVTLIKFIDVDITDRVRGYASADGIYVPAAKLPSGKHTVRVSIADQDGLRSAKDVTFEVIDSRP